MGLEVTKKEINIAINYYPVIQKCPLEVRLFSKEGLLRYIKGD